MRKLNDDEVLSGEGASKRLANSLVYSVTTNDNWNILVKQCGHTDLLERLQALMPAGLSLGSKADCDSHLAKALLNALEVARKDLAQRISESRARAEAERQKVEAQKRKKRIKTTAILCAIVAVIIVAISLPSIIENAKTANRESYVEEQIQAVIVPLEKEMEDATGVDVIIDYNFSLEEEWDYDSEQWYEWTFSVKLPIFEEYRNSNSANEQSLLEVMNACKTLVEIYDDVYDDLDFEFRHEDARIVMRFSGGNFGSLKIHDTSTTETFYYEEYGGDRYLHSSDTEYVLDKSIQSDTAQPTEDTYNEPTTQHTPGMFLDYQLGDSILPDHISKQIITINEVNGHLYYESTDNTTIDSLYWVSSNSNGNKQEIVDTAHERIISYFESRYGLGKEVIVPSGVFPHYWGFDDETVTQYITETGLAYLVGPDSEYNIYVVQIKEPY